MKKRIDLMLVERGLVETRSKAQAMIMAGEVLVNDNRVDKSSEKYKEDVNIRLKTKNPYVSRAAYKLLGALEEFEIKELTGFNAVDIGSSTGGFTEVLLQYGVKKVYAIDVGTNQLAYKLRIDKRVEVHEKTNARSFDFMALEDINIYVGDLSFISLKKIFPAFIPAMQNGAIAFFLIKPQFEVGREIATKFKGIITDSKIQQDVVDDMLLFLKEFDIEIKGVIPSPIKGNKGNQEFVVYFVKKR